MNYEKTLIITLLFVFSVFLFPNMNEAVQLVSPLEPLRPLIINFPLIYLSALVIAIIYSLLDEMK